MMQKAVALHGQSHLKQPSYGKVQVFLVDQLMTCTLVMLKLLESSQHFACFLLQYIQLPSLSVLLSRSSVTIRVSSNALNSSNRHSCFISACIMTTMDDFDIFNAIYQTDQQLYPLTFCYEHSLGYQDTRHCPFHQLSLEAKLNIECNKCTATLLPKFLHFCQLMHLCLPSVSPSLLIYGNLIV